MLIIAVCNLFTLKEGAISLISVIGIVISVMITNIFIVPLYLAETYESSLTKHNPVYKLIAAKFPVEYKAYISKMKNIILKDGNVNEIFYDDFMFLDSIYTQSLMKAGDESIYNYFQAKIELDKAFLGIDPGFILYFELPHKFKDRPDSELINQVAKGLLQKYINLKEKVIISAIQTPQPPLTDQQINKATSFLKAIMLDLNNKNKLAVLKDTSKEPDNPKLHKHQAALAIMSLYENILSLGVANTGLIIRYIASKPSR